MKRLFSKQVRSRCSSQGAVLMTFPAEFGVFDWLTRKRYVLLRNSKRVKQIFDCHVALYESSILFWVFTFTMCNNYVLETVSYTWKQPTTTFSYLQNTRLCALISIIIIVSRPLLRPMHCMECNKSQEKIFAVQYFVETIHCKWLWSKSIDLVFYFYVHQEKQNRENKNNGEFALSLTCK